MIYQKLRNKLVSDDGIAVSKLTVLDKLVDYIVNDNNDRNNIKMSILIMIFK